MELQPTIFVLFGATGDLAKRLVLPAFYQLAQQDLLPRQWLLVGNGRGNIAHEDFRKHVHDALEEFGPKPKKKAWEAFSPRVLFAGGGFTSDSPGSLLDILAEARRSLGGDPRLVHYLAIPPVAFAETTRAIGRHGPAENARVVYEKPFGTSPRSFRALDRVVHSVLDEQQVYRIDHFLGKEATQDLHLLRFANGLFAAMWNRQHVESVQIDVPEKLGITARRAAARRVQRALVLPGRRRRDRPVAGGQEARPGARPGSQHRRAPAGRAARRRPAAALRPADPRRPHR